LTVAARQSDIIAAGTHAHAPPAAAEAFMTAAIKALLRLRPSEWITVAVLGFAH